MATQSSTGITNATSAIAKGIDPGAGNLMGRQESLSQWAGPYVTSMLGKAEALSEQPYQVYGGPLTAGASELQQKYFQGLGQVGFPSQLGQTFSATGAAALPSYSGLGAAASPTQAAPTGIAANYMNPYLGAVLAPQLSELQRQAQIAQSAQAGKLAQAGAYGGSRQAIMEAEMNRNLLEQMNRTIGTGYATAYDKAMDQFNKEQSQAMGLAGMLSGAGATQRDIEAQGIAADLAEFQQQRDYPYKMLQFQQSMLQGMPIASVAAQYQQPSALSSAMQTGGGLMDLYQRFFANQPATTPTKP